MEYVCVTFRDVVVLVSELEGFNHPLGVLERGHLLGLVTLRAEKGFCAGREPSLNCRVRASKLTTDSCANF